MSYEGIKAHLKHHMETDRTMGNLFWVIDLISYDANYNKTHEDIHNTQSLQNDHQHHGLHLDKGV